MIFQKENVINDNAFLQLDRTGERNLLLRRLFRRRVIGGKHLPEVLVLSWVKHASKQCQRQAMEDYEEGVKAGIIRRYRHTGEWHVSINPNKLQEALRMIDRGIIGGKV
jgi:hypothetical protein